MTEFRLDANGPFDHRVAAAVLAAHRIESLGAVDGDGAFRRLIDVGGQVHEVGCLLDGGGVAVRLDTADGAVAAVAAARVRHWFDLDADLGPIDAHLRRDPRFTEHVDRRPGVRITRAAEPFEAVVQTVLGQQVTLAACRTFGARLVGAYGERDRRGLIRFPSPRTLAGVSPAELQQTVRITGSRALTVIGVAEFFADQVPDGPLPPRPELASLYGIGPWTLDYLAVRAGDDPDVFPAADAVLRRMLGAAVPAAASDRWRPYRSYAAFRLWAMSGMWPGSE